MVCSETYISQFILEEMLLCSYRFCLVFVSSSVLFWVQRGEAN